MIGQSATVKAALAGAAILASLSAVDAAGPAVSSNWLAITIDQNACIKKASDVTHAQSFNSNFEVVGNLSVYGARGDYTSLVRCAAEKGVVYFVVAGPQGAVAAKDVNALRDNF
jgi:hypothetical protein